MFTTIEYTNEMPVSLQVCKIEYYPLHYHNDIQIIYLLEGEIDLKLSFSTYKLKRNDLHFIHNGDLHGVLSASANNLAMILSFKSEAFSQEFPDLNSQIFTTKISNSVIAYQRRLQLQNYILLLASEIINDKPSKPNILSLAKKMIRFLYTNFRGYKIDRKTRSFEHAIPYDLMQINRISRIVMYLYENYPYKVSLEDIAKKEHLNKHYLSHLFKRLTGESFRDFLSMVRVEMSEHHVLCTNKSISSISSEFGFSKPAYYASHFFDWYGLTPENYRQLFQHHFITNSMPIYHTIPYTEIEEYLAIMMNNYMEPHNYSPVHIYLSPNNKILAQQNLKECIKIIAPPGSLNQNICKEHFFDFLNKHTELNFFIDKLLLEEEVTICSEEEILFLKTLMDKATTKTLKNIIISFFDLSAKHKGLVTSSGLLKPQFHILRFFLLLYESIIYIDDSFIATTKNGNYRYLIFNDTEHTKTENLMEFLPAQSNIKITEHRLIPERSYKKYIDQLCNYSPSESDCKLINKMTLPDVSFTINNCMKEYTHTVNLNSREILFGDILLSKE